MTQEKTTHRTPEVRHIGVFDMFRIGIGPSSSHTVGPMRAAGAFIREGQRLSLLAQADRITCQLFGALALTGRGHGTDTAVLAGLAGADPEQVLPEDIQKICAGVAATGEILVAPEIALAFLPARDLVFSMNTFLPRHPNAMTLRLWRADTVLLAQTYYSIGGGFIETGRDTPPFYGPSMVVPHPFATAQALLDRCAREHLTIAELALQNELAFRSKDEIEAGLDAIWAAMQACVARGLSQSGVLPGGLNVKRRAADLYARLLAREKMDQADPLRAMEWVNLYALAVNEENAAGGRVVTAPTNGAAGIIPAVLHYLEAFVEGTQRQGIHTFLLTAAAIGSLIKRNASISGADVGCQGEVGSAAAMAAAGLAATLGGTNEQVENAAEIALEHNLGLTCDPVGGLVQIPCIERNAVASIKAINAARLALHGDGQHRVSLDQVIETLRQTGRDMGQSYKETSRGGLAVNVPEC